MKRIFFVFAMIVLLLIPPFAGTQPVSAQQANDPVKVSGWFSIVWGDSNTGAAPSTVYTLTDNNGKTYELLFNEKLSGNIRTFDRKYVSVKAQSVQQNPNGMANQASAANEADFLSVDLIELTTPPQNATQSGVSPAIFGSYPWISIMCKFPDKPGEPKNLSYFQNMYANTKPGLDHYWREQSYNQANVAGSSAAGWFTMPHDLIYYNPSGTTGGANLDTLANDCAAAADPFVNFANYQGGINMMFNFDFDNGYAWGGSHYFTLDGVSKTWNTTWEPPWGYDDISVIMHEMGHGFGLPHSSGGHGTAYDSAWDVMSDDRYNCPLYDDPTYGCMAQHTISYHKDLLGWIPSGQKYNASGGPTQITIDHLAIASTANYRMAQIPIQGSGTNFYTVEVRQTTNSGYDTKLPGKAVIIHEVNTIAGWSEPAHVVDIDGNSNPDDAGAMFVVGETFTDAANGITVTVNSITTNGFNVTITAPAGPILDDYEPDNSAGAANPITSGIPQTHSILPLGDEDWVTFTLSAPSAVTLATSGALGQSNDTRLYLYDSSILGNPNAVHIEWDDDDGPDLYSYLDRVCGVDALPAGTYYVMVDEYGDNAQINSYDLSLTSQTCEGVSVEIGGSFMGLYPLNSGQSSVQSYPVLGGPVVISSSTGADIIASMLQLRRPGTSGGYTGITQLMGVQQELITDTYVLPRYNGADSTLYNSIQVANLDSYNTNVIITIGGTVMGTYPLAVGASLNQVYSGVVGGPVVIESDNGAQIIASLYELKRAGTSGTWTGQNQMMGVPLTRLSTTYVFPRYNDTLQDLDAYLVFANADSVFTNVTVTIGGVLQGTYPMDANTSQVVSYPVLGGPVVIASDNGANIIASMLQLRRPGTSGGYTGITQLMGVQQALISNTYVLPRYNGGDSTLYNSVQVANFDTISTNVTITIGGTVMGTYPLAVGASLNQVYTGTVAGPIVVTSDNGAQIVVSLYELKRAGTSGLWTGQTQMMGLPFAELSNTYVFPRYNDTLQDLDASLIFAVP